uniref:Uncharacterized protein n=1 Tax=Arundo donax TaxID=35708 RepID=A0A0A9GVW2_ARUDO
MNISQNKNQQTSN